MDVFNKDLRKISEVSGNIFPGGVDSATILRWVTQGVNGVRLEWIKVGKYWYTTEEAFQRFAEAQTRKRIEECQG